MSTVATISLSLLAVAAGLVLFRLVRGPHVLDRIISV